MEETVILHGQFANFTVIGYLLWQFGIFCGHLVFFPVLVFCTMKNLATLTRTFRAAE
jgi:hypothetical protein